MTSQQTPERDGILTELDGRDRGPLRAPARPPARARVAGDHRAQGPRGLVPGRDRGRPLEARGRAQLPVPRGRGRDRAGRGARERPAAAARLHLGRPGRCASSSSPTATAPGSSSPTRSHREETAQVAAGWQIKFEELEALLAGEPQPGVRPGALERDPRGLRRRVRRGPRPGSPGAEGLRGGDRGAPRFRRTVSLRGAGPVGKVRAHWRGFGDPR